jgi:GAF domain-containing protein
MSDSTSSFAIPVLTEDASLRDALTRLALLGNAAVPGSAAASITIIVRDRAVTMGSSNPTALELDAAQYTARDGPCLTAAREKRLISIDDTSIDPRWPSFTEASQRSGVRSSLSVPLPLEQEQLHGGFNLYGNEPEAFGLGDIRLGTAFATQATTIVLNAEAYWAAADLSRNLAAALETRGVIDQAKGVLMSKYGFTADEAFDELRKLSQRLNRKLNEVAANITDEASGQR